MADSSVYSPHHTGAVSNRLPASLFLNSTGEEVYEDVLSQEEATSSAADVVAVLFNDASECLKTSTLIARLEDIARTEGGEVSRLWRTGMEVLEKLLDPQNVDQEVTKEQCVLTLARWLLQWYQQPVPTLPAPQLTRPTEEVWELGPRNTLLQSTIEDLQYQLMTRETKMKQLTEERIRLVAQEKLLWEAQDECQSCITELHSLKDENTQLKESVSRLKKEVSVAKSVNVELHRSFDDLQVENVHLKEQLQHVRQQNRHLQGQLQDLLERLNNVEEEKDLLIEEINKYKEKDDEAGKEDSKEFSYDHEFFEPLVKARQSSLFEELQSVEQGCTLIRQEEDREYVCDKEILKPLVNEERSLPFEGLQTVEQQITLITMDKEEEQTEDKSRGHDSREPVELPVTAEQSVLLKKLQQLELKTEDRGTQVDGGIVTSEVNKGKLAPMEKILCFLVENDGRRHDFLLDGSSVNDEVMVASPMAYTEVDGSGDAPLGRAFAISGIFSSRDTTRAGTVPLARRVFMKKRRLNEARLTVERELAALESEATEWPRRKSRALMVAVNRAIKAALEVGGVLQEERSTHRIGSRHSAGTMTCSSLLHRSASEPAFDKGLCNGSCSFNKPAFNGKNMGPVVQTQPTVDSVTQTQVTEDYVTRKQVTEDSVTQTLATADSVTQKHVTEDSVTQTQATVDSVTQKQATIDSVTQIQATAHPVTQKQATEDSVTLIQATADSVTQKQATEDSFTQTQATADSMTQKQATEGLVTLIQATADSVTQKQATKDSVTLIQATADSVTKKQATKDSVTLIQATADSVTQKQATEDSVTLIQATADSVTQKQATEDSFTQTQVTAGSPDHKILVSSWWRMVALMLLLACVFLLSFIYLLYEGRRSHFGYYRCNLSEIMWDMLKSTGLFIVHSGHRPV